MASFYFLFVLGTGLLFVRSDTFYPLSLGLGLLFAFLDTFCRLLLGTGLLFTPSDTFSSLFLLFTLSLFSFYELLYNPLFL